MSRQRKKEEATECKPPISAMIDVVFLLLIYFVLTQKPVVPEAHLSVNLPGGGKGSPSNIPLTVSVMSNDYYLMDIPGNLETIEQTLSNYAKQNKKATVTIKTAVDAKSQRFVNVLDMCHKLELTNLNVVTLY